MRPHVGLIVRFTAVLLVLSVLLPFDASARTHHGQNHQPVVVLDPGHGGPDSGAVSPDGTLVEKVLTLEVAKAAAKDLTQMGYKVFLTRTRDESPNTPPRDVNGDGKIDHVDDLVARNVFANRHHADVFVSIHFDAGDPSVHGTHGYYCPARPFWKKSELLAELLTKSLSRSFTRAGYPSPANGVQTDVADIIPQTRADYPWFLQLGPPLRHFVIATAMPGALIETLYVTSPSDEAALHRPGIIAAAARGYAQGIQAYLQQEGR